MKTYLLISALVVLTKFGSAHLQPTLYCSPVTLNGQPLAEASVEFGTPGVLAIIQGDPDLPKYNKPMAFRVMVRRANVVVKQWSGEAKPVYSLQLGDLWPSVQFGDELVLSAVPVSEEQVVPNAVIKIKAINWLVMKPKKDGC
ncbi:hypothetical protein [Fibrella aquatilis]|uniref:Uncharacterized protein n=1 Tax=Fibrella aquatilis TaxID=2817059 RepID=A0A939G455_9BACT|nr:hypothetical protein [Fibrella aquatilis]MBO0930868.1 hypothetical protein [Fibrella aquatilis]